ncbi:MAG: hypothetical protein R2800_12710 [Flavipsychrobacter sp.]
MATVTIATAQIKTEKQLVSEVLMALQTNDDSTYATLFPKFGLLWSKLVQFQDTNVWRMRRVANMRAHPELVRQHDPAFNDRIVKTFNNVYQKGVDSNVHWADLLIAGYELEKQPLNHKMRGFEVIAPIRMHGILFVKDMLTRKKFGIALRNLFLIDDNWYGGEVLNIIEAESTEEYHRKAAIERRVMDELWVALKNGELDSIIAAQDSIKKTNVVVSYDDDGNQEDTVKIFKEITERKLYVGKLDNEIDIVLYVRGLKGSCPEPACHYEAIYKFGDLDEYLILTVTRKEDGTWAFEEEDVGVMELKKVGKNLMGAWISFRDNTEYEAMLTEKESVKGRQLFKLDKMMDDWLWGE